MLRIALSSFCVAGISWGLLLTNGSFEDPAVGVGTYQTFGVGSGGITGWTVTGSGGNVAVVSQGPICCGIFYNSSDGNQLVDMSDDSDNGVPKGVIQSITLDPAATMPVARPFPSTIDLLINGGLVLTPTAITPRDS